MASKIQKLLKERHHVMDDSKLRADYVISVLTSQTVIRVSIRAL